jgi:DNA-binding MarR family transcriptional regulator
MATEPRSRRAEVPPADGRKGPDCDRAIFDVLRYSHIFASAVREVLEEGLLREICPHPLSVAQFHLLRLLSLNGLHQVGEAAGFLGISPPAATKNIDKLEMLGLASRRPSTGDRRATLLTASRKGRRLVRAYEELIATRFQEMASEFTLDELKQLARLLERMSVSLFASAKPESGFCLRCAAYIEDHCPISHAVGGCTYQDMRQAHGREGETKAAR